MFSRFGVEGLDVPAKTCQPLASLVTQISLHFHRLFFHLHFHHLCCIYASCISIPI